MNAGDWQGMDSEAPEEFEVYDLDTGEMIHFAGAALDAYDWIMDQPCPENYGVRPA